MDTLDAQKEDPELVALRADAQKGFDEQWRRMPDSVRSECSGAQLSVMKAARAGYELRSTTVSPDMSVEQRYAALRTVRDDAIDVMLQEVRQKVHLPDSADADKAWLQIVQMVHAAMHKGLLLGLQRAVADKKGPLGTSFTLPDDPESATLEQRDLEEQVATMRQNIENAVQVEREIQEQTTGKVNEAQSTAYAVNLEQLIPFVDTAFSAGLVAGESALPTDDWRQHSVRKEGELRTFISEDQRIRKNPLLLAQPAVMQWADNVFRAAFRDGMLLGLLRSARRTQDCAEIAEQSVSHVASRARETALAVVAEPETVAEIDHIQIYANISAAVRGLNGWNPVDTDEEQILNDWLRRDLQPAVYALIQTHMGLTEAENQAQALVDALAIRLPGIKNDVGGAGSLHQQLSHLLFTAFRNIHARKHKKV